MTSLLTLTKLLTFCHVSLPELDSSQSVLKPLFHQSAQISGGAGQRLVLEDRPLIRGKADRTSFPQAPAAGRSLLQDSARPALIQVIFISPCRYCKARVREFITASVRNQQDVFFKVKSASIFVCRLFALRYVFNLDFYCKCNLFKSLFSTLINCHWF